MSTGRKAEFSKRHSISFSSEHLKALESLAERNNVSISWLVRLAVGEFIHKHRDTQLPLDFRYQRESPR